MIREKLVSKGAAALIRSLTGALMAALLLSLAAAPALAFSPETPADDSTSVVEQPVQTYSPYVMAYDKLDVEDRQGYNSEYIFGMTKGIMKSTLVPALKPVLAIFTIPLDIAFLPFAAIIGFF